MFGFEAKLKTVFTEGDFLPPKKDQSHSSLSPPSIQGLLRTHFQEVKAGKITKVSYLDKIMDGSWICEITKRVGETWVQEVWITS